jgi:hypothetical protein
MESMMKRLLTVMLLVLLCTLACSAQSYTTVTGTVTDPAGTPFANGKVQIAWVPGASCSSATWANTNIAIPFLTAATTLSATGVLTSMNLPDNRQTNCPNSQWSYQVCSVGNVCFTTAITITGASQNIGATLSAASVMITVTPTIVPPTKTVATLPATAVKGTLYTVIDGNSATDCTTGLAATTVTCAWSGSAWTAVSGGGGGGGGTTINPTNNVVPVRSNATTFINSPFSLSTNSGKVLSLADVPTIFDLPAASVGKIASFRVNGAEVSSVNNDGTFQVFSTSPALVAGPTGATHVAPGTDCGTGATVCDGIELTTLGIEYYVNNVLIGTLFNTSGVLGVTFLPANTRTRTCEFGLGDGANAITASANYTGSGCFNNLGGTYTITAIRCFSDNNGTTTTNPTNDAGTALLTGALTCSNAFASGTQSATTTIASTKWIKFPITADGTTKTVTVEVTYTW